MCLGPHQKSSPFPPSYPLCDFGTENGSKLFPIPKNIDTHVKCKCVTPDHHELRLGLLRIGPGYYPSSRRGDPLAGPRPWVEGGPAVVGAQLTPDIADADIQQHNKDEEHYD